ncbi:MAG: hypothetical protein K0R28_3718 [Paenibacillus sp.]|nr:hypothetical protein [Paenibacillus sp.]
MKSLNRYRKQTLYMLFVTLPFSIIGFVLSVTFTALGLALTPLWIGLPILHATLRASRGMMRFDLSLQRGLLAPAVIETLPSPAAPSEFRYRDMFTQAKLYAPLLYWLVKLPTAVLQFAAAVVLPLCGACIVLSPLVYVVLSRYGIEIFTDDLVLDVLLPTLTAYQRSWIASGIGLAMVLVGIGVLSGLAASSVRWLGGLSAAAPVAPDDSKGWMPAPESSYPTA